MTASAADFATRGKASSATRPQLTRLVVILVGLSVLINYVDRGALPTAAPLIRSELHLNNRQIGVLLSAFFWTYVPVQLAVGWLIERLTAWRVLAIGVLVWATATTLTGLAHGFGQLLSLRLLLGIGECVAFPCASKMFGAYLPDTQKGWANAIVSLGLSLGPAFGVFFGGELMGHSGWRPVFMGFGLISALWLVPWTLSTRRLRRQAAACPELGARATVRGILAKRAFWGSTGGHFFNLIGFYFVVSWLPLYLVRARGFSMSEMAVTGGEIYLVNAASALLSGWASDWMTARGFGPDLSRKAFVVASGLFMFAGLTLSAVAERDLAVLGLFIAGFGYGLNSPNLYAIAQVLAGPRAAGQWVGLMNGLANTAGILSPLIIGWIVDETGSYVSAFALAGGASLTAAAMWAFVVGPVREVNWGPDEQAPEMTTAGGA